MTNAPEITEALHGAMAQTYFHWGFHAWAMYALVGGAIAYAAYRRGRSLLLSSIFQTLFGKRQLRGLRRQARRHLRDRGNPVRNRRGLGDRRDADRHGREHRQRRRDR